MSKHVVVLGAGFGGLELSSRLSDAVSDHVRVTLIDQNDAFVFGFSKLDVLFGHRLPETTRHPYRHLVHPSVEFRQEKVLSIDPHERRVTTDASTYEADILVVALGADLDPGATPGFLEAGHEFYSPEGAEALRGPLGDFSSGVAVVGVLGPFFKCPPAPNEAAFMLHDYLVRRGIRSSCEIHLLTPLPMPIPISSEVSGHIVAALTERGIHHRPQTQVVKLDPSDRLVHLGDGSALAFDLFLGIPVHCAPPVVVESGLTEDGWIAVDQATFATRFPGVYAVGDVTSAPFPRAGVIAEGEADTLADVLISQLTGSPVPPPYEGGAVCYIEMGNREVARVDVNFLAGAVPTAQYHAPSAQGAEEKREFAANRLARWFGSNGAARANEDAGNG